jgi:hypothetical protein
LRTDKNVRSPIGEGSEELLMCRPAARGITIPAQNASVWEETLHRLLHALGSYTEMTYAGAAADGTHDRHRLATAAIVAEQDMGCGVKGHPYIAVATARRISALAADDAAGSAAPVKEENRLLAIVKRLVQRLPQRLAEDAGITRA